MAECRFRFANESDCRLILKFIRSLAKYEKMEDEVVATELTLRYEWLFEKKKAEVIFAMEGKRKWGLPCSSIISRRSSDVRASHLEDLYVRPSYRLARATPKPCLKNFGAYRCDPRLRPARVGVPWIGTSRASTSRSPWAPYPRTSGRFIVHPERVLLELADLSCSHDLWGSLSPLVHILFPPVYKCPQRSRAPIDQEHTKLRNVSCPVIGSQ